MKLKYYLRGLGIGIIVTALLMGYSSNQKVSAQKSTVEKATEIESLEPASTEVSSSIIEETASQAETVSEADAAEQAKTTESQEENSTVQESETVSVTETDALETMSVELPSIETPTQNQVDNLEIPADAKESYLLNVVRGDDSGTVARKLQTAGLIDNASEFDAFLMQHGYDKKISVGVVEIPMNATWVEIAEKLAGN